MNGEGLFWLGGDGALRLRVRVDPRSSRPGIGRVHDNHLRVRLSSAPVEGKANGELIGMLAKILGLRKNQIEIVTGENSRQKTLRLWGLEPKTLKDCLGLSE